MRAYIAYNMDDSDELYAKLKLMQSKILVARKDAYEGVRLLRKVGEEREVAEAKTHQLKEEREVMKEELEKEWLKQEMEELWAVFTA